MVIQIQQKVFTCFVVGLFMLMQGMAQTPCVDGMAGIYPCENVDLAAFVPLEDIGDGDNTNDIWGWVSPLTKREYALVGCSNGTAFLDISNPVEPVYLGLLPTHTTENLWRDLESDERYLYIGSEASGHGLQIFDLYQLDYVSNGPIEFEETAHFDGLGSSHTITLDPINDFVYCNGSRNNNDEFLFEGGLYIVDVSDPLNPSLAGGFAEDGYTHDCFVWNYDGPDTDYSGQQVVLACNGGSLTLVNCTDKTDCQLITTLVYPDLGYVHQGWITKDKKHFLVDDELDEVALGNDNLPYGTRTHIFNIEDLDNVVYMGFFENDNLAIDHNLYIKDQFVYQSNYRSGVRILDAVKVSDGILKEVGSFDLFPQNNNAQFSGTWSNYPYLPSGVNIATSMYEGFFILQPRVLYLEQDAWDICLEDQITIPLVVNGDISFPLTVNVSGIPGALVNATVIEGPGSYSVLVSGLSILIPALYEAQLTMSTLFGEQYVLPISIYVNGSTPSSVTVNVPLNDGFVNVNEPSILVEWSASNTFNYEIEIATDDQFSSIVETQFSNTTAMVLNYMLPLGDYFIRVRPVNDCGNGLWSDASQFSIVDVSTNEIGAANNMKIYPNPAEEQFIVSAERSLGFVRLMSVDGRLVWQQFSNTPQLQIDTTNLTPGVYTLVSDAGNSLVVIR
jgi:choice-of-anchor B domain-containing protein